MTLSVIELLSTPGMCGTLLAMQADAHVPGRDRSTGSIGPAHGPLALQVLCSTGLARTVTAPDGDVRARLTTRGCMIADAVGTISALLEESE